MLGYLPRARFKETMEVPLHGRSGFMLRFKNLSTTAPPPSVQPLRPNLLRRQLLAPLLARYTVNRYGQALHSRSRRARRHPSIHLQVQLTFAPPQPQSFFCSTTRLGQARAQSQFLMAATNAPPTLEKKPVKFSNLLCKSGG